MTKSVLAVTAFHLIIIVMFMNSLSKLGINITGKLIIMDVSIVLWFLILVSWNKKRKNSELK